MDLLVKYFAVISGILGFVKAECDCCDVLVPLVKALTYTPSVILFPGHSFLSFNCNCTATLLLTPSCNTIDLGTHPKMLQHKTKIQLFFIVCK